MKVDIWMPLYTRDYLADTMHLSAEKHGVYLLLIIHYWMHKGLPPDIKDVAVICRVPPDSTSLSAVLKEFFIKADNGYSHSRIDKELFEATGNRKRAEDKAKNAADARWAEERSRKEEDNNAPSNAPSNASSNASGMLGRCSSPSPSPIPIPLPTTTPSKKGNTSRKRFVKPSASELKDYGIEISFSSFDPEKFINYYDSNGWIVGKVKMKDWKATMRGWKGREDEKMEPTKAAYNHGGSKNFEL